MALWYLIFLSLRCLVDSNSKVDETCGTGPTKCPIIKKGQCRYRPYDGSCSTPENPRCGSIQSLYARLLPPHFNGKVNETSK